MAARETDTDPGRREDILRVAAELFAEHGFHAVGMRAIADAVGVRSSSIYYHFPSKMDILFAIALEATHDFVASQLPRLESASSSAEQLKALLRAHVEYFYEHRVAEAVGLRELRALEEERREQVNHVRRTYQRALRDVIAAGKKAGEFNVEDPHLATLAVLNMINGVNTWFRDDGPLAIDDVVDQYVDLAVHGILGAKRADSN